MGAYIILLYFVLLTFICGQLATTESNFSQAYCSKNISSSGYCIEFKENECCKDQFCCNTNIFNSTDCHICEQKNVCCPLNFCCSKKDENSNNDEGFQWYHGIAVFFVAAIFYKICCPNEEQRRRQAAARARRQGVQHTTNNQPPVNAAPAQPQPDQTQHVPPVSNIVQSVPPAQRTVTFDLPPAYTHLTNSPPNYGFNLPPPILNVPDDLPPPPAYPGK